MGLLCGFLGFGESDSTQVFETETEIRFTVNDRLVTGERLDWMNCLAVKSNDRCVYMNDTVKCHARGRVGRLLLTWGS